MTQFTVSEFLFNRPQINLSAKAKAVMAYLAFRSNKINTCFPALKTIAQGCSISLSSVKRAIKELLGLNLVQKNKRYRADGGQTSNLYILNDVLNAETVEFKEKDPKKKISPKLSNSSEDTFLSNVSEKSSQNKKSVCLNNTPNDANVSSSSDGFFKDSFPCNKQKCLAALVDQVDHERSQPNENVHDEKAGECEGQSHKKDNIAKSKGIFKVQKHLKCILLGLVTRMLNQLNVTQWFNKSLKIKESKEQTGFVNKDGCCNPEIFANSDPPPGS